MQIDAQTWRSPNHGDALTAPPIGIMLHSCEGALPDPRRTSLPWLCNPSSKVSCNYYVTRAGVVYCLVDGGARAWHAGAGAWNGIADGNTFLGIELEHRKGQGAYPEVQRTALAALCCHLIDWYSLPKDRIIAHRWWAPRRKQDPTDWPDGSIRHWLNILFDTPQPPPPQTTERTYRLLHYAWVRSDPTVTSERVGSLEQAAIVQGVMVIGVRHKDSDQWLKVAQGYVWAGQVAEVGQ